MAHMPATPPVIPVGVHAVYVRDYGAAGDGVTDDTTALAAAIATGRMVFGRPGDTYLVDGGLVVSTVRQVIDLTGCGMKLKSSASSKIMLRLNAEGAKVIGGKWDMNVAGNTGGDTYTYAAVSLTADHTVVEGAYVHDSHGLGILGSGAYHYREVRNCRIEDCEQQGIFFDGPTTADSVGTRVSGCTVIVPDVNGGGGPVGIYVHSASPYTYTAKRYIIEGNTVVGPSSATLLQQVGITGRGLDGIVRGNHVLNFDIGISIDLSISQRTVIEGNRVEATYTRAIGIEINGGHSTVSNNVVIGHQYGIVGSTQAQIAGDNIDGLLISGNRLKDQTLRGIQMTPAATNTAYYMNIIGNVITSTTALEGFIRLRADCKYALIEGNVIQGPGSAGGYGVFLEDVPGNVTIRGNRFAGLLRAGTLYSLTATSFPNVAFDDNDVSLDIGAHDSDWLALQGTAALGTGVRFADNFKGANSRSITDGAASAAPSSGTWVKGDRVTVRDPSDGGHTEWVCTTGGTPGTWRKAGLVSASAGYYVPGGYLNINGDASNYSKLLVSSNGGAGNGYGAILDLNNTDGATGELRLSDTGAGSAYNSEASMLTVSATAGYGIKFNVNAAANSGIRIASGSPGIVTVYGELDIDGALNHDGTTVGFYGTAPIAKQTGVAVDAAGIHAALVALGLIGA